LRYGAVREPGVAATISGRARRDEAAAGLAAVGPRSITQSAHFTTSRLCSMTSSEWPAVDEAREAREQLLDVGEVEPVVGSSKMSSVCALPSWPRCAASLMRWPRRPTASRAAGRGEVVEPDVGERPQLVDDLGTSAKNSTASATVSASTSETDFPR
jgi:hypothetical protein